MNSKHYYAILSKDLVYGKTIDKQGIKELYKRSNWQTSTTSDTLYNIVTRPELLVIRTDNLVVIDFDDDLIYKEAVKFNEALAPEYQCKLVVHSSRRGGHFYFAPNPNIEPPLGHTKQSALDFLTTSGHNVIGPTKGDSGKTILSEITPDTKLTMYSNIWHVFVSHIVLTNLPDSAQKIVLRTDATYSDDNIDFVKLYLSNIVTDRQFNEFYNIPDPIPAGMSNEIYKRLSTRLACDETVSEEDFLQAMHKFNAYHKRKTDAELMNEHIRAKLPDKNGKSKNGLWRYDPDKQVNTFKVQHKEYKTTINCYYSAEGLYYIVYPEPDGTPVVHIKKGNAQYKETLEKLTKETNKIKDTSRVPLVKVTKDYSLPFGFNKETKTLNIQVAPPELEAFNGAKPENYSYPKDLLELCRYMWDEETDYILASTKRRYATFEYTECITFFQGEEGSGKDLSIYLLTRGFGEDVQLLDSALLHDKHATWQTKPNAHISEIGDWTEMDKKNVLAKIKNISGANGTVTVRDMQKTAETVKTLIKIWVTGNTWVRLFKDLVNQRRVHPVYMGKPLRLKYTKGDIDRMMSRESILNFYYWLGNECDLYVSKSDYNNPALCRKNSYSYKEYIEAIANKDDLVCDLLYTQSYENFARALEIYDITLNDIVWKYSKNGNLVVAVQPLKTAFKSRHAGQTIMRMITAIHANSEKPKSRIAFPNMAGIAYYIEIYGAPDNLDMDVIEGEDIEGV